MNFETPPSSGEIFSGNLPHNLNFKDKENSLNKTKSSLRLKYEAERRVLRDRFGDLEEIRKHLGLSKRKMSQLLLVDPSAWTRWSKKDSEAPPHIYRALQWYMELIEKRPEWAPQNSFHPYTQQFQPKFDRQWDEIQLTMEKSLSRIKNQSTYVQEEMESAQLEWQKERKLLEEKIERKDASLTVWKLFVLLHSCVFFFALLWMFL